MSEIILPKPFEWYLALCDTGLLGDTACWYARRVVLWIPQVRIACSDPCAGSSGVLDRPCGLLMLFGGLTYGRSHWVQQHDA